MKRSTVTVLPGRARRGQHFCNAHPPRRRGHGLKREIAVVNEIARRLIPRKRFAELLRGPRRRGMGHGGFDGVHARGSPARRAADTSRSARRRNRPRRFAGGDSRGRCATTVTAARSGPVQHLQLMPQRKNLEMERGPGPDYSLERRQNGDRHGHHLVRAYRSQPANSTAPTRTTFSVARGARRNGRLTVECLGALRRINLHWHDLRHEYASRLAERGVPLSQIRDLLGHHSIVTTERYDQSNARSAPRGSKAFGDWRIFHVSFTVAGSADNSDDKTKLLKSLTI
jgi:hypothetical protein